MKKYSFISSFKGIAILGIILVHTAQHNSFFPKVWEPVILSGGGGVQLFFILSSLGLLYSMKKRIKIESFPWRNFFLRRFFRIAPMFYLTAFFYLVNPVFRVPVWSTHTDYLTFWGTVSHIFFLNGLSPYWMDSLIPGGAFIGTLAIFYMIFPLIFKYIRNLRSAVNFFAAAFVIYKITCKIFSVWPLIPDRLLWDAFLYYWLPAQLPVFILGIIIYYIIEAIENKRLVKEKETLAILLFLVAFFIYFKFIIPGNSAGTNP